MPGATYSPGMNETSTITAGRHPTRVLDKGEGAAVVILHGWGGRIESMSPVVSCLAARFRVLALDLPGFGESPPPSGSWGTPDYAAFVRDVLAEKGVARAHFLGHSFGGKTSLYLAATHGGVVDKLILVDPTGLRSSPSLQVRAKRTLSKVAKLLGAAGPPGRAARSALYRRISSSDYQDAGPMRPTLVRVVNEDLSPLLSAVRSPTLIVWGTEDEAVPVAHGRTMERLIPDAGLVLFEGAGHFPYLDERDRFCRIVRHFLGVPLSP